MTTTRHAQRHARTFWVENREFLAWDATPDLAQATWEWPRKQAKIMNAVEWREALYKDDPLFQEIQRRWPNGPPNRERFIPIHTGIHVGSPA